MKELFGKMVYDSLGEIVDPRHTAVIVVDMQNDGCAWNGYFAQHGTDVSMEQEIIPDLVGFIGEARKAGALVVWLVNITERAGRSYSPAWLYLRARGLNHSLKGQHDIGVEGTWGAQIMDQFKPLPEEPIVKKHRSNAFVDTNLNLILRSNKIESVIVTGVVTQGCVESTARGASFHDYYVVLLRDCVASYSRELHEASLKIQASRYDVVTSKEVVAEWARLAARIA